jgi:type IV secretory pathway component VirB8
VPAKAVASRDQSPRSPRQSGVQRPNVSLDTVIFFVIFLVFLTVLLVVALAALTPWETVGLHTYDFGPPAITRRDATT